jgi:hypothetical protein
MNRWGELSITESETSGTELGSPGTGLIAPVTPLVAFRWLAVAGQGATIAITWPLWQVRVDPPLLPAVDWQTLAGIEWPQFSPGAWLLLTLVVALVLPRTGAALHVGLLVVAMLLDQTRMQPEVISLGLLLIGTLPGEGARLVGRAHLIALWFFAGFHKLLSPEYFTGVMPAMFGGDATDPSLPLQVLGGCMAAGELSLGVLAVVPRLRRTCAVAACAFHLLVLLWLAGRMQWNPAVWPWNLVLAAAGFALVWPWTTSLVHDLRAARWVPRATAMLLLVSPLGYYFGLVDPYLAHCLYTRNVPKAQRMTIGGPQALDTWSALRVPLPPAHRILEQFFKKTALPSERLVIDDPRWWAHFRGWGHREINARQGEGEP